MRKTSTTVTASFKTPFYPWFPLIALVLSIVCLVAIVWYDLLLSAIFFIGSIAAIIIFRLTGKHKMKFS
jgi:ethanolamine permease